ncbi:hypothetical protein AB0K14_07505 [Actinosynnema sp. NPDC050801]|uniref:hypothetical protein n=1 Tax=unclassified Actinosynnema TaxID=2637065 RepID=UPI0033E4E9E4
MGDALDRSARTGPDDPPTPTGVSTLDELCARLRDLRLWAGSPSFTRIVQDIAAIRAARGLPVAERRPGRVTVYECFRPGRRRIDVELLVDIVAALGVDEAGRSRWRRAHRAASAPGRAETGQTWPETQARTVAALVAALGDSGTHGVVNLVGPVGSGKTTALAALPGDVTRVDLAAGVPDGALDAALADPRGYVVVDNADSPAALAAVCSALGRRGSTRVVVAGRRPLSGWPRTPSTLLPHIAVVPVPPWQDREADELAARSGVTRAEHRAVIVAMAGGIPLLVDRLCRAVHLGARTDAPGALADLAVTEVLDRLGREGPAPSALSTLALLASSGQTDHELFPAADFAALAELSLVYAAEEGLDVHEPYRTMFDHVHRRRRPLGHRRSVARALVHHREVLAGSTDLVQRARRTEQSLWLTGDPTIRDALFPTRNEPIAVRASTDADTDEVMRLLHRWARRGELDVRSSERVLSPIVADRPDGFRIATDPNGEILGAITALPLASRTHHLVEPLLQDHAPDVANAGGVFVGMAIARDNRSQAALLRDVLMRGISSGQVVVATQWPAYQRLVRRLDFTYLGATQGDVFRCGRPVQVHTLRLAPADLAPWVARLTARGTPVGDLGDLARLTHQLGRAYKHWHTPALLADSPLLSHPSTPTVRHLRAALSTAAQRLAGDPDPARAAAGQALLDIYLSRRPALRHYLGAQPPAPGAALLRQALTAVAQSFWPAERRS